MTKFLFRCNRTVGVVYWIQYMPECPIFVVHWLYKLPNITIQLSKHLNLCLWGPVWQNLKTDSFSVLFVPLLSPSWLYFHIFPNSPEMLSDFRKSELSLLGVIYVCIQKAIQLKPKLQHTGTRSAAALPPHRLCYRPAVFFRRLRLIDFHSHMYNFGPFQKCYQLLLFT